ncbi:MULTISPECIES: type II toxin-antitoxin system RelE family toxin [Streptomyces]|uniref:type II toxin-antitoxin system RelE family toxin n=1 Tax=Streptomyces TaxID=1883 RepID=UPI00345BB810
MTYRAVLTPDADKKYAALDEYDQRLLDAALAKLVADPFDTAVSIAYPGRGSDDFRSAFVYGIAMVYVVSRDTTPPHVTITDFDL